MFQSVALIEADEDVPVIPGETQDVSPVRRQGLIVVAMLACVAVVWTTKVAVGSNHAELRSVPPDAIIQSQSFQKAKQYDWKDSNLALFGSDNEKKVKKEAADAEPAWMGAGQEVGLQVWRIKKFKVVKVPRSQYGEFYDGDSYIVLNSYKKDDQMQYDVHFWIGKDSTQDEYGTAAYKTVELDTKLDDRPVQHREVMNHESDLFKSYFENFKILNGGFDTGFSRVIPDAFKTRLIQVAADGSESEVALKRSNLKSENVYVIDCGKTIYQWNGAKAGSKAKFKAAQLVQELKDIRNQNTRSQVLEEIRTSPEHPALKVLRDDKTIPIEELPSKMWRLSDSGPEELKDFGEGLLETDKVMFIDTAEHFWIWIGKDASTDDKQNSMAFAHQTLMDSKAPLRPISVVGQGFESADLRDALASA